MISMVLCDRMVLRVLLCVQVMGEEQEVFENVENKTWC